MHVSRAGVLRHRSVFGGAESVNDPIHSGIASTDKFRGVKESLLGGGMPCPEESPGWANVHGRVTCSYRTTVLRILTFVQSRTRGRLFTHMFSQPTVSKIDNLVYLMPMFRNGSYSRGGIDVDLTLRNAPFIAQVLGVCGAFWRKAFRWENSFFVSPRRPKDISLRIS